MQIVSIGVNLHEKSYPIVWKKNNKNINLSSAELARRVVKVKIQLNFNLLSSM